MARLLARQRRRRPTRSSAFSRASAWLPAAPAPPSPPRPRTSGRKAFQPGPALFSREANRKVPSQKRLRPTLPSGWPSTASSMPARRRGLRHPFHQHQHVAVGIGVHRARPQRRACRAAPDKGRSLSSSRAVRALPECTVLASLRRNCAASSSAVVACPRTALSLVNRSATAGRRCWRAAVAVAEAHRQAQLPGEVGAQEVRQVGAVGLGAQHLLVLRDRPRPGQVVVEEVALRIAQRRRQRPKRQRSRLTGASNSDSTQAAYKSSVARSQARVLFQNTPLRARAWAGPAAASAPSIMRQASDLVARAQLDAAGARRRRGNLRRRSSGRPAAADGGQAARLSCRAPGPALARPRPRSPPADAAAARPPAPRATTRCAHRRSRCRAAAAAAPAAGTSAVASARVRPPMTRLAIDIGAATVTRTAEHLRRGWQVIARHRSASLRRAQLNISRATSCSTHRAINCAAALAGRQGAAGGPDVFAARVAPHHRDAPQRSARRGTRAARPPTAAGRQPRAGPRRQLVADVDEAQLHPQSRQQVAQLRARARG